MTVREARESDAAAIASIYAHYVETSASTFDESAPEAAEIAQKIADCVERGLPFAVAEDTGAVRGYGYLTPHSPRSAYRYTADISVYVAPDERGRGIGRAVVERLLAEGGRAGVRQVIAVIAVTEDEASIGLHRACGFREAGRLTAVGYKLGRWWDVLLMQRTLLPS